MCLLNSLQTGLHRHLRRQTETASSLSSAPLHAVALMSAVQFLAVTKTAHRHNTDSDRMNTCHMQMSVFRRDVLDSIIGIHLEPELAEFRNWNPAGAGARFGENWMNLFLDQLTIHQMKLMASTMLSAAIIMQHSSESLSLSGINESVIYSVIRISVTQWSQFWTLVH